MKKSVLVFNEVELSELVEGFIVEMKNLGYAEIYIGKLLAIVVGTLEIKL